MSLTSIYIQQVEQNKKKELEENPTRLENAIEIWLDNLAASLIYNEKTLWTAKIKQIEENMHKLLPQDHILLNYNGNDEIYEGIKGFKNSDVGEYLSESHKSYSKLIWDIKHRKKKFNESFIYLRPIYTKKTKLSLMDYFCCNPNDEIITGYQVIVRLYHK